MQRDKESEKFDRNLIGSVGVCIKLQTNALKSRKLLRDDISKDNYIVTKILHVKVMDQHQELLFCRVKRRENGTKFFLLLYLNVEKGQLLIFFLYASF